MKFRFFSSTQRALSIFGLIGSALAAGCFDTGLSSSEVVRPTLVGIEPSDFMGSLPCTDEAGTLRRYVATFIDVTGAAGAPGTSAGQFGGEAGGGAAGSSTVASLAGAAGTSSTPGEVVLPSSQLVGCQSIVVTSKITLGHSYVAEIDGYEATSLQPRVPGERTFRDASGQVVTPRWTTRCDEHPVTAVSRATQFIRFCAPLRDARASSTTPALK